MRARGWVEVRARGWVEVRARSWVEAGRTARLSRRIAHQPQPAVKIW